MNRFRHVSVILLACLLGAGIAFGQTKKSDEKSPADLRADAFVKLRDKPDTPPTPARFAEVMGAGFAFINEFPADRRTAGVVKSLAEFGATIRDKKQAAQRAAWLPQLKFELLRQAEGKSDEVRAALAALAATIAGLEMREAPSRATIEGFREKIDTLASLPGGTRFLADQERAMLLFTKQTNLDRAEKDATALLKHADKGVAAMARDELNLILVTKQPIEFKGTALDGRAVDLAALRGKAVLIFFWSTTNENSLKELAALKQIQATLKKSPLEIITVSQDRENARDAVAKAVKDAKLTWPVLFDGQGNKGELSQKLNVRSVPNAALFNPQGTLVVAGLRGSRVESELKKLFGIK